jgi:N6-adenosine-specific RNA methylase IME4
VSKGRSAEAHYDCLDLDAIKSLPVTAWADRDAALYLWCTAPHLENALAVMAAWGFPYKSERMNEAARDVGAMLAAGHHPYQIEQISKEMLQVVAYPCGRPGCPTCGGGPN